MNPFDNFFCSFYSAKTGSSTETGLGSSGIPRRGKPKTEAERLATHQEKYSSSKLPARGTGLTG